MKKITVFIVIITAIKLTHCGFPNVYGTVAQENSGNSEDLLILTPLIEENKIELARQESEVNFTEFQDIKSYSGYLTVNKIYNSNLFFWFFPSRTNYENDPVLLWLQGGPGSSSLLGLFRENGPFTITEDGIQPREYAWTNSHSIIYIDNPVGAGFSFTQDGYAQNETQIGEELYIALQQFFTMFPELQNNEFFVTGESYAGKYIPAISYTIHTKNPESKLKINLQGMAIGNGLSDPEHQLKYGKYLYQLGLIDSNTRDIFESYEEKGINYIKNKEYDKAFEIFDILINGDLTDSTIFKNTTGFDNYFNYLYPKGTASMYGQYVQKADVRKALHVGNSAFGDSAVEENLVSDIMQSVAPWISELLENYRVLIYSGQLDIIVAYPLTVNYLQNLEFNAAEEYKNTARYKWYVDDNLAGFVKQAGNLTEVLVRNAGHMVPAEQPEWAYNLIYRFTRHEAFYDI